MKDNKIYPPGFTPAVVSEPVVSAAKKTAVLKKMKEHMTENRGYDLKELIDFVQHELIFGGTGNLHVKDCEVAKWIEVEDEKWGWHPPVEEIVEPVEG